MIKNVGVIKQFLIFLLFELGKLVLLIADELEAFGHYVVLELLPDALEVIVQPVVQFVDIIQVLQNALIPKLKGLYLAGLIAKHPLEPLFEKDGLVVHDEDPVELLEDLPYRGY